MGVTRAESLRMLAGDEESPVLSSDIELEEVRRDIPAAVSPPAILDALDTVNGNIISVLYYQQTRFQNFLCGCISIYVITQIQFAVAVLYLH